MDLSLVAGLEAWSQAIGLIAEAATPRIHDIDPFLIRFGENFGIRYYGLSYLLGFLMSWVILNLAWKAQKSPLNPELVSNLILYLIVGVLAGGRIGYYLFYHPDLLLEDPLSLFRVWEGGMASHGAFIGVFLALVRYVHRYKVSLYVLGDLVCITAPIGVFFGRIANFINGELWGKVTDSSWGWVFPQSAPHLNYPIELLPARHPSQLYQAGLEGLLLALWMQFRFWRKPPRYAGVLAGEFFIGYAILRSIGEIFREPDAELIFGLSRGTFYSIFLLVAGSIIILSSQKRKEPSSALRKTQPS
jgi:phosphatidylglycerol:prolipoprotein diacylglycerol transferase